MSILSERTANQNYEASSTVLLEFSKQNTIIIDTYGNNGYIKEFDLNNNNYALSTTLYTLCNSLDNDGDGITNKNDLDDDNDGILEIHHPALIIGQAAIIQHLQHDVPDVGVRFFDLIQQNHAVWLTSDRLR